MKKQEISNATIEALSRNFFKEADAYGFKYEHYLNYVNSLLEIALSSRNGNGNIIAKKETDESDLIQFDNFPLKSRHLTIRKFNIEQDIDLVERWIEDKYGRYFLLSLSSAKRISLRDLAENESNVLGIIMHDETKEIGLMAFLNNNPVQHKAELRKLIGEPPMRGRGFGKEATKLWIKFGHTKLNLNKIYLNTIDTNIRNIKLNEELGFRVEGILRNEIEIEGVFHDVLRMGLWKD